MPNDISRTFSVPHQPLRMRVCLVTEELAGLGRSGGIGAAMLELSVALASRGAEVEIFHLPLTNPSAEDLTASQAHLAASGVVLRLIDPETSVWAETEAEKRSYCVYLALRDCKAPFDVVHFHDYKGLGFYALGAKRQGLDFAATAMVVQAHGPSRWALEVNHALFSHVDQLKIDYMERRCIELADWLVSPSAYLIDWMESRGFRMPAPDCVRTIRNACALAGPLDKRRPGGRQVDGADIPTRSFTRPQNPARAGEIILFARHEDRKGVQEFLDALDLLNPLLSRLRITVTFLGGLGDIGGHPSGIVLTRRALNWTFPISIHTAFDRGQALSYLRQARNAVVIVPSPRENSPYAVVEAASAGLPVITSTQGGARELLHPSQHDELLCDIEPHALARAIRRSVEHGLPAARLAETAERTAQEWQAFHREVLTHSATARALKSRPKSGATLPALPRVVLGITHHDRPAKLMEAIISAMRQTYANIQVVVIDDGSKHLDTIARLDQIEVLLNRCNGMLIRRKNGYLGAARNEIMRRTESDYILFLDDDDLALPTMIETLVQAATNTQADITTCFNLFMDVQDRLAHATEPASFKGKLSYAPLGGPLSAATIENCLGSATSLFRRSSLVQLGGYTELKNVGHEDYELYVRALQAGMTIEVVPRPLYLYEVGRPSMVSRTSIQRNFQRVGEAIDITAQPAQWKDAISLLTAQSAIANSRNRRSWEYRNDPHQEILTALLERRGHSPESYAALLATYAEAIGAQDMVQAWQKSTDRSAPLPYTYKDAILPSAWVHSEILLLLAGSQTQLAANRCAEHLEETMTLDAPMMAVVDRVVMAVGTHDDAHMLRRLGDAVSAATVGSALRPASLMIAASMAGRRMDAAEEKVALQALYDLEEACYLESHPDVRMAVEARTMQSGLHHYLHAGAAERRKGFEMMTRLALDLPGAPADGLRTIGERLGATPVAPAIAAPEPALPPLNTRDRRSAVTNDDPEQTALPRGRSMRTAAQSLAAG